MCVVNIILLEVGCHSQINKVNGITSCITHDKKKSIVALGRLWRATHRKLQLFLSHVWVFF